MRDRLLTGRKRFKGEAAARQLLHFVNAAHRTERERAPVLQLVSALQGLVAYVRQHGATDKQRTEIEKLASLVDDCLRSYRGSVGVQHIKQDGSLEFDIFITTHGRAALSWLAMQMAMSLARAGRIQNLRPCEMCSKWFFAKFPKGRRAERFCESCKAEHRREYNRDVQAKLRRDAKAEEEQYWKERKGYAKPKRQRR